MNGWRGLTARAGLALVGALLCGGMLLGLALAYRDPGLRKAVVFAGMGFC